jgi:hypothetical protein
MSTPHRSKNSFAKAKRLKNALFVDAQQKFVAKLFKIILSKLEN